MAMPVTLATTYGDPKGRLFELFERQRSKLFDTFAQVAVRADVAAYLPTLDRLGEMGARIDLSGDLQGPDSHGRKRREALALALETDGHFIFSCDMEQALRWLDGHPSELRRVLEMLSRHDATIVGRSERALLSYPRHIRDTEKVVNRVYALFTGRPYDLMAGYLDLGPLKGNRGNQNYEIPADVDLSEYGSVVIYCQPFHVIFATAPLN